MIKTQKIDYLRQHSTPWHKHTSGQLYWLEQGVMVIETLQAQWHVTAGTLGWFPTGIEHRAWFPGNVKGSSLYLSAASCTLFPPEPGIYGVDHFVFALLARLELNVNQPLSSDYLCSLLTLLSHEIKQLPQWPLELTLPSDRRARNVAEELLRHPATRLDQAQLAHQWGLSVRNLSRLFNQQTGLSFSQWRQQAKIVSSLQWITSGLPIGEVAERSGYSNISAYIEAFRLRFGKTPGQFKVSSCQPSAG
ncbi:MULTISPECIES: AraC family transcriptional regulator [unclassified Cedecea]|uniref:AraC family transcriptional regulator n=1 Tax=unclassified Cedecea TaxID=2649846 RepID=UPI0030174AE3